MRFLRYELYRYDSATDVFVTWSTNLANSMSHSDVYSISYGVAESLLVGYSNADSFNTEIIKICAMGVTVLVSSGDDGAAGYRYRSSATSSCAYDPEFPASSPYVTAVGATMGVESGGAEVSCQKDLGASITSGGGFSLLYSSFSQQQSAITAYFQRVSTQPYAGYSTTGRGVPDVSLAGHNYVVVDSGNLIGVDGTSASTPAFAGMVTLINAARRAAGLAPLGWLNPALYASGGSFANDITSGNNKCTESTCCLQGYYAAPGWDPVTGFGSVDFRKLYNLLVPISTPAPSPTPTYPPTWTPSATPSRAPSVTPTAAPSALPSSSPTVLPSASPSVTPTAAPSAAPSSSPTIRPSASPSARFSKTPTFSPTFAPFAVPSSSPTARASTIFTKSPAFAPSFVPTPFVTSRPSRRPSITPSITPSSSSSRRPS